MSAIEHTNLLKDLVAMKICQARTNIRPQLCSCALRSNIRRASDQISFGWVTPGEQRWVPLESAEAGERRFMTSGIKRLSRRSCETGHVVNQNKNTYRSRPCSTPIRSK